MKKALMNNKRMIIILLFFLSFLSIFISIRVGSLELSFTEIISAIFFEKDTLNHNIIFNIRLARTLVAALVGIALALSGAILQGIMGNPLADPGIIGVSSGGALAAFIIMILFPNYLYLVPVGAFVGAFLATILIYTIAWKNGIRQSKLILAGVAVTSVLGAGINVLMTFYPEKVTGALSFMIGGLSARTWTDMKLLLPYTLVGSILTLLLSNQMNILSLGDEMGRSLGVRVEVMRVVFIILSSFLAASAVSVAGLLGFVGLIVPHICRQLIGSDHKYLFPAIIAFGSLTLVLCDTIARTLFSPVELPVGIIMSILGGPFFIYLLKRGNYE